MDGKCIDHHKDHPDQRGEERADRRRDEPFDIEPDFLELSERLAAPLVLEHCVGELKRVPEPVGIEPGTEPLGDDVDEIILEVLRDARDECHSHGRGKQEADTTEELRMCIVPVPGRVLVNDVPEDQRIEEGEYLVYCRQDECEENKFPIAAEVAVEDSHY